MATLNTRIVLRNDTSEKWQQINPILFPGEIGAETDTGRIKVGNGSATWQDLPYAGGESIAQHYEGFAENQETDMEVIARILDGITPTKNDIFIVKRLIANDKYTHTAYIFDNNWTALDGNYSAENIFFKEDFIANVPLGSIRIPSSGSTTVAAKGKSLQELLKGIMYDDSTTTYPETTQPSLTVSITNEPNSIKIGDTFIPTFAVFFNEGSYSFNTTTGVAVESWNITDNYGNSETSNSGTMPRIVAGEEPYILTITANYSEGSIPVDSKGQPYPAGQIAAGSVTKTATFNFIGHGQIYAGSLTTSSTEEPLTEELITSLSYSDNYDSAKEIIINAGKERAKRIVVAYPSDTQRSGLEEVQLTSAMGMDITSEYKEQPNIGTYKVFVYEPSLLGSDEKHKIILG